MKVLFFISIYFFYVISSISRIFYKRKKTSNKTVLFLAAFYPENSGYNWRVEKWAEILMKNGWDVTIKYALSKDEFQKLNKYNHSLFLMRFLKMRFLQVLNSRRYEIVIVRRELLIFNDYGNLFLEKLLLKFHPCAILDFDDDLTESKKQPKKITNLYARLLFENGDKFNESLKRYKRFIVASNYLKSRVLAQNELVEDKDICVVPTCIDYDIELKKLYTGLPKVLGWIGGDHNYYLLDTLLPLLNKLYEEKTFTLLVIGGEKYIRDTKFPIEFKPWSLENEVELLLKIDIGLMPLINDRESMGKGGFKLIQYMGLGIVSVASPITINNEIVEHGKNSFLANDQSDWYNCLFDLLSGKHDLIKIGNEAKSTIIQNYSFLAHENSYLEFVNQTKLLEKV